MAENNNSLLAGIISIHAPPRGATRDVQRVVGEVSISIHAPPRGATSLFSPVGMMRVFQFTPLREGRRAYRALQRPRRPFQFTPLREGRLCIFVMNSCVTGISIHAPPRGATAKDMQFLQIFCSTLTNQHGLTIVPRNLSRLFW